MRAIVHDRYGSFAVLGLRDIDKPVVKDDEVLVRVHAAGLHVGDCFGVRGAPFALPRSPRPSWLLGSERRNDEGDEAVGAIDRNAGEGRWTPMAAGLLLCGRDGFTAANGESPAAESGCAVAEREQSQPSTYSLGGVDASQGVSQRTEMMEHGNTPGKSGR